MDMTATLTQTQKWPCPLKFFPYAISMFVTVFIFMFICFHAYFSGLLPGHGNGWIWTWTSVCALT
jgi:hypothetical protein